MKSSNRLLDQIGREINELQQAICQLDELMSNPVTKIVDEKEVFNTLIELNQKYPANPLVLGRMLTFLQLVNDDDLSSLYTLDEVSMLYSQLVSLYPYDLDLNLEYYHFVHNIDDDEARSAEILEMIRSRFLSLLNTP